MDLVDLSFRSRLVLLYHTEKSAVEALTMPEHEFTYELFLTHNIGPSHFQVASVSPGWLKRHGVDSAAKMKVLGYDALHLAACPVFCNEMVNEFGVESLREAFLTEPQDAVSLAGSHAIDMLGIATRQLLETCIGYPSHAVSALYQLNGKVTLNGCSAGFAA